MIKLVGPGEINSPYSSHQLRHFKGLIEEFNPTMVITKITKIGYDNGQPSWINSFFRYRTLWCNIRMASRSVEIYCAYRLRNNPIMISLIKDTDTMS